MKFFPEKEISQETETPLNTTSRSSFKWVALVVGTFFGVSHIGLLGYVLHKPNVPEYPVINFPQGNYSSYKVEAGEHGYRIEYKANDPAILESHRSLNLISGKKGLFGRGPEHRTEYRTDQYTMDGIRNIGGATTLEGEGKSAKEVECIVADAGARSQGAMAGTAISGGLLVPALANIPYVGWLAGGWALLLGQKIGSEVGSQVGSSFNDC